MSVSRKRHGHPHQPKADIPAKQRTSGRVIWAALLAVFGLLIGLFAGSGGYVPAIIGAVAGAIIGYFIGKNMEKESLKS